MLAGVLDPPLSSINGYKNFGILILYFKEHAKWYFLCQYKPPSYKYLKVLIANNLQTLKLHPYYNISYNKNDIS